MDMYEPIKNRNNHQYIVDEIKKMILYGQLKVGDKLPPERELAELYQVSRTSIREALKFLEAQGLLEIRQGDGNYIANHLEETSKDLLSLVFVFDECKRKQISHGSDIRSSSIHSHLMQSAKIRQMQLNSKLLQISSKLPQPTMKLPMWTLKCMI